MSDTEDKTCPAATRLEDQTVTCRRELDHAGVHLGHASLEESGVELHQWPDSQSLGDDSGPVSELPVWYHVLPIGEQVRVGYRDDRDRVTGELTGAVLDDHEQLAAIRLHSEELGRHVLIPWGNVAVLSWEGEK